MAMWHCEAKIPELAQIQKADVLKPNAPSLPTTEWTNNFKSSLFWVDTQFMLVVIYGRQTVQDLDCSTLEDWTNMLSRNVDKQIPTYAV